MRMEKRRKKKKEGEETEEGAEVIITGINEEIQLMAYADDTVIYARSLEELIQKIKEFEKVAEEYNMILNMDKTQVQTRKNLKEEEMKEISKIEFQVKDGKSIIKKNAVLLGAKVNINTSSQTGRTRRINLARLAWNM